MAVLAMRTALEKHDAENSQNVATRGDVRESELRLQKEIREVELSLQKDIREVELRLQKEIREVELRLEKNMAKMKQDLFKWQIAGWLSLAAIMAKGFNWLGF